MGNEHDETFDSQEAMPTQNVEADPSIFEQLDNELNQTISHTSELLIVSFYITGRSNPVIVTANREITIGRRDPKRGINPTIDLTEDHGAKLGVSRLHAELSFLNGAYYLKDMSSSNGTWVNDTKLEPYHPQIVNNGDTIRIGQIAIIAHITLPQRMLGTEAVSTVIENDTQHHAYKIIHSAEMMLVEQGTIITTHLARVGTYLYHLSAIHDIIREAQGQDALPFTIVALRARAIDDHLIVEITEGDDLMRFMANQYCDFLEVQKGKLAGDKKQTDSLQHYDTPAEQLADYALQELVFRFLNERRDSYVKRLAAHFDPILTSRFSVQATTL